MELLETCTSGNHNDVEEALAKNCDVEIKNEDGWTPLIVAASFNFDRVVEVLLHYGANIDARTPRGSSALNVATSKGANGCTALGIACDHGENEIASMLLNAGVKVDYLDNHGWSPLCSALKGHEFIVNTKGYGGATALRISAEHGNFEVVRMLVEPRDD
ncbi:hypothetical protein L917_19561 [Phytophthora nicotianae]|uniref:Uncharacterized protein n=1 Tax=Phytophthora nicotianae TaxID=4792 RepID=W2K642_PHYNI|nr:hypothetical protein L917_19561 [Phytophthora nicotianae]